MKINGNLACQEELREEILHGEAVAMSPLPAFNHNQVAYNIARLFGNFLAGRKCTPIAGGMDLYLTEQDIFVPDFMVVCDRSKIRHDGVHGAPDLVAEVLSPSTAGRDCGYKMLLYGKCGVREYWLVSPEEKSVEVYLTDSGQLVLDNVYTVQYAWAVRQMPAEERAAVVAHFRCSLFDDLEISLDDIFSGLLP